MNVPGTSRSHGSSNGTDRSRAVCREPVRAPEKLSRSISKEKKRSKPAVKKRNQKKSGRYEPYPELLGVLGVIVNCALIGQSGLVQRIWPDLSWGGQILIIVVLEHVILASKMIIDILVPDVPHWVRIETAKQEHFRREAFKRESRLLSHTQTPSSEHLQNQMQNNQPEPGSPDASSPRFNRLDQINRSKRRSITPMVRLSSFTRKPKRDSDENCID